MGVPNFSSAWRGEGARPVSLAKVPPRILSLAAPPTQILLRLYAARLQQGVARGASTLIAWSGSWGAHSSTFRSVESTWRAQLRFLRNFLVRSHRRSTQQQLDPPSRSLASSSGSPILFNCTEATRGSCSHAP